MLPILFVGTVIVGTFFYTVLKEKIQQWIVESKMSRLSLNKRNTDNSMTIVISDDESDTDGDKNSDPTQVCESKVPIKNSTFHTDDITKESCAIPSKKITSMFSWENTIPSMFAKPGLSDDKNKTSYHAPSKSQTGSRKKNEHELLDDSDVMEVYLPPGKRIKNGHNSKCADENSKILSKEGADVFSVETDEDDEDLKNKNLESDKCNTLPEVIIQKTLTVSGIEVKLPVNPYSCQTAVISKIIQACNAERNCLLESPTGSGKTLALLCGVLAWQEHLQNKLMKAVESMDLSHCTDPKSTDGREETSKNVDAKDLENSTENFKQFTVPKIFYGTRTHRQIEQVIREFKKTAYRHKRMTILSSREHTCIQTTDRNKTEFCNELLDPVKKGSCPYLNKDINQRPLSWHNNLQSNGLQTPWDIEDFVEVGKRLYTCPYFSARDLKESAEIIFCPYNYLVDPGIRESMDISLNSEIVILDEAHNIEDICRDVASKEFREDHLQLAAQDLSSISAARKEERVYQECRKVYKNLANYMSTLANLLASQRVENAESSSDIFRSECWTGEEFEELLKMPSNQPLGDFEMFNSSVAAVLLDFKNEKESFMRSVRTNESLMIITEATGKVLETLSFCLQMITSPVYRNDYRICIVDVTVTDYFKTSARNIWISTKRASDRVRILQFMCMNSAVTFAPMALAARSIILASGTLSPTTSFASELGTEFPFTLSAQHIIPKEQVYIRCIPRGPTGKPLKATYQYINQWAFQEELGRLILSVCQTIPHGILCFFSSYNTLNNHIKRWKETEENIWGKLQDLKRIFIEPRFGMHFGEIMEDYRNAIKESANAKKNKRNGAVLFAVFRGKVAEGIDFSDDEARCVLAVGIPYAVRKDPSVDMKYMYNDLHHTSKKLLKGGEWYAVQAFRALNQALGRCVRHQNDWGAVLLVDERFLTQTNIRYLPRWIQAMMRQNTDYNLETDLQAFVSKLKGQDMHDNS